MTVKTLFALLVLAAVPAAVLAQDSPVLWTDLAGTRPMADLQVQDPPARPRGGQERGGQVAEEWYGPRLKASVAIYGRISFPSSSDVTVDHLWYSDFFKEGYGVSGEFDLLSYLSPSWAVGGYLSVGWDSFNGQRLNFINGDFAEADHMDLTTVMVGAKVVQRFSPYFLWDGHMGIGMVHYGAVNWSGFDTSVPGPFTNEQLFSATNTMVGEFAGRIAFGVPSFEVDFGMGFRIMGGPNRGRDVNNNIDPDIFSTFMLELGLTVRF